MLDGAHPKETSLIGREQKDTLDGCLKDPDQLIRFCAWNCSGLTSTSRGLLPS